MQKCEIGGVEVKVGQVWSNRSGVNSEIVGFDDSSFFCIRDNHYRTYSSTGRFFGEEPSNFDLTKLVKDVPEVKPVQQKEKVMKETKAAKQSKTANETFDFKVGETYFTRAGEVVTIVETAQSNPSEYNRTEYTAQGSNEYCYTALGRIFVDREEAPDIVAKAPVRIQSSTSANQSTQSNQLTHSQISKMRNLLLAELATVNLQIQFEEERETMFFSNSDYSTKEGRLYFELLNVSKNKLRKLKKQRNELADTLKKLKKQQQDILRSSSK